MKIYKKMSIWTYCDVNRDNNRTMYRKQVYMDKNTSPIVPKPLKKKQMRVFYKFLLETIQELHIPNHFKCKHGISTDNPSA
jgi:hypothetical protein